MHAQLQKSAPVLIYVQQRLLQTGANSVNVGMQQVPLAPAVSALSMSPLVALDERAGDQGMLPWRRMLRVAFRAGQEHRAREREREQEQGRQASGEEPGPIEGPNEGLSEGPSEGPNEGPSEGPSESDEQLTAPVQESEGPQPALGSSTGPPHVTSAQADLPDRSADTPMTETMSSHERQQLSSSLRRWDQLVADPFGLLMHLFASSLASQCSSAQQACPWDETRDGGSSPGDVAIALQKPAALLQVHFCVQLRKSCWYICSRTTSCSQTSNQLMHSMPHMHVLCTHVCHVNLQHHTSRMHRTFNGMCEMGALSGTYIQNNPLCVRAGSDTAGLPCSSCASCCCHGIPQEC